MPNPVQSERPAEPDAPHVAALVEGHPVVMLTTMVGRHHSSRPVVCAAAVGDRLSFLARRDTDWVRAVEGKEALVHVTVADHARPRYLSLNGTAHTDHDPAAVRRLWDEQLHAPFFAADDGGVVVVEFDVTDGECWTDGDGDGQPLTIGGTTAAARSRIVD